jgi:D-3-phosphoglycerate dehydrogenase
VIGALVAEAGRGLGMNVLVWGRDALFTKARAAGYRVAENKAKFFASSDVLSLRLRFGRETRGIVVPEDLVQISTSRPTSTTCAVGTPK